MMPAVSYRDSRFIKTARIVGLALCAVLVGRLLGQLDNSIWKAFGLSLFAFAVAAAVFLFLLIRDVWKPCLEADLLQ